KAVGAGFAETGWRQAAFAGCALAYAAFDRARLREVAFSDCDLSHAVFHECTWKRLSLDKTRLREASFLHTPLAGLDLTGCELDGLAVSDTNAELRGAIVTAEQAAMLAKRLGLVIKE
ncbi:pentapeptide repeat-containing protein, partial [Intestinibacillus massiliensis]